MMSIWGFTFHSLPASFPLYPAFPPYPHLYLCIPSSLLFTLNLLLFLSPIYLHSIYHNLYLPPSLSPLSSYFLPSPPLSYLLTLLSLFMNFSIIFFSFSLTYLPLSSLGLSHHVYLSLSPSLTLSFSLYISPSYFLSFSSLCNHLSYFIPLYLSCPSLPI